MENVSDAMFEQLLADTQEAYELAKADNNWTPPPGEYTCVMTQLNRGTKKDDQSGTTYFWIKPTFKIAVDPVYQDQEFGGQWMSNRDARSLGGLKSFLNSIVELPSGDIREDLKAAQSLAGNLIVKVRVKERPGKDKNGNAVTFTNVYIGEVLHGAAA